MQRVCFQRQVRPDRLEEVFHLEDQLEAQDHDAGRHTGGEMRDE